METSVKTHGWKDLSSAAVEDKDVLSLSGIMGEDFVPLRSEFVKIRVWSPDLRRLIVETDAGLVVGLEPPRASFFQQTLDDDSSYKLLCSVCAAKLHERRMDNTDFLHCKECARQYPYRAAVTSLLWMSEGGVRLSIDKAQVRVERSGGAFPVTDPKELETYLITFDFVKTLVEWLDPYGDALRVHPMAWDLADMLDQTWRGWKSVKRYRREGKLLSGFRELEAAFNAEDWPAWTRFPRARTGEAVPVSAAKSAQE